MYLSRTSNSARRVLGEAFRAVSDYVPAKMSRPATEKKVRCLTHRLDLVEGLLLANLEASGLLREKVFLVRGHFVGG